MQGTLAGSDRIWALFLDEVRLAYGEDATPRNFLGSADRHKACFDIAFRKYMQQPSAV